MQVVCAVVRLLLVLNKPFTSSPQGEPIQKEEEEDDDDDDRTMDDYREYYRERREMVWTTIKREEERFGPHVFWHVACNARFAALLKESLSELAHVRASAEWTIYVWTRILLAFKDDDKESPLLLAFFGDTSSAYVQTTLTSLSQWRAKEERLRYVQDVNEVPFIRKYYDMLELWMEINWTFKNKGKPIYTYLENASCAKKIYQPLFVDILRTANEDESKYPIDWLKIIANILGGKSYSSKTVRWYPHENFCLNSDKRVKNLFSVIEVMEEDKDNVKDKMNLYYNGGWTLYGPKKISKRCKFIKDILKKKHTDDRIEMTEALIALGFRWNHLFANGFVEEEEEEEERIVIDLT